MDRTTGGQKIPSLLLSPLQFLPHSPLAPLPLPPCSPPPLFRPQHPHAAAARAPLPPAPLSWVSPAQTPDPACPATRWSHPPPAVSPKPSQDCQPHPSLPTRLRATLPQPQAPWPAGPHSSHAWRCSRQTRCLRGRHCRRDWRCYLPTQSATAHQSASPHAGGEIPRPRLPLPPLQLTRAPTQAVVHALT